MKKYQLLGWMTITTLMPLSVAFAYGEIQRLQRDAYELNHAVQSSYMNYEVKEAVSYFTGAVDQLSSCEASDYSPAPSPDYPPLNRNCSFQLQEVTHAWDRLDPYLSRTEYQYPHIYRIYSETRLALTNYLRDGNSGYPGYPGNPGNPGYRQWNVDGSMDYRNFSFTDSTKEGINRQCVQFGRYNGIQFVRELVVNGQRVFFAGNRIEAVCRMIADRAIRR
jgi:hypothetical protein